MENTKHIEQAMLQAFHNWSGGLVPLRKFSKLRTYGYGETPESIWQKLPRDSKQYWLSRTTRTA